MNGVKKYVLCAIAGVALLLGAGAALADSITYTLLVANTQALGPGPYGTVTVTTDGTATATVLFTANTAGGYAFMDGGSAAVNCTLCLAPPAAGNLLGTQSPLHPAGGTTNLSNGGAGNEDGFGSYTVTVNNADGWADALATISFTLTKASGTWGSAASVLTPNSQGNLVAAHVGFCTTPATGCTDVGANTGFVIVPIPAAAWLFGSGLVGLIAIARRRIRGSDSPALA